MIEGALAAILMLLLALPWFVHAAVVLLSALGARPLAGRAMAVAILLAATGFACALAQVVRRRNPVAREPEREDLPPIARFCARVIAGAGALAFMLAAFAGVALPFVAYDALAYRLPLIAQWLDAGRIAWVATDDPVRNGYPMGQEAISAVVAAACGSLRLASVPSFAFIASGAFALWLLAEQCGVRRTLARAGAGLFALVPMMILNAPSGYVDAAFAGASVSLFCCAALLASGRARSSAPTTVDWPLAAATGMSAAHVLAIKGTGLAFVAWVGLSSVGHALWQRERRGRATWLGLGLAGAFALPGAFWVLRNLVRTGNPLWPVAIQFAGRTLLPGVGNMDYILDTFNNTPPAYRALGAGARLLRSWFEWQGPAADFDARMAGLGLSWPLLALPAVLAFALRFARERDALRRRESGPIAFVLWLSLGCFALQPMSWWPRYTLWLWGGGALTMAAMAERLTERAQPRALALLLGLATLLGVGEAAWALPHAKDANIAMARVGAGQRSLAELWDVRRAPNALTWISPEFWRLGIERDPEVCRGWWKPKTDNPNLDGVLAQLSPRPRVRVFYDDDGNWTRVRQRWLASRCPRLLLFSGSPVLRFAELDPVVLVERAIAFDPLFVVRPRPAVALGRFGDLPP